MKDFKSVLKRLNNNKVIDYKVLHDALSNKPCTVLDKEAELIFKICEWRHNDKN